MKWKEILYSSPRAVPRRALVLALSLMAVAATAAYARQGWAAQTDGRPRRTQQPAPSQTPTPSRPAQTPTPAPRPAQTASPTPAPGVQIEPPPGAPPQLKTAPAIRQGEDTAAQGDTGQEVDPDEVVTVESNLVNLQVRVVDRNNRPINDVRPEEFKVFENGIQQQIQFVTKEEVPISYGLVVDNSGSLRSQIIKVVDAAKAIISGNKPGDETFVVRFISSDEIKIMQDFTADRQSLEDALDDMFIEGGQTAVVDAVYLSAEHAAEHKKGNALDDKRRRALILVTDGEDRNSFYKTDQLWESLKEEDVQIFVIGFVNELESERGFITKSRRQKAVDLLDKMAKETGGRAFYPTSLSELPDIAEQITKDLRTQYVVSYAPTAKARPGEFRQVRVAVADAPGREKRIAVTRSGYTGKAPAQSPRDGGQTAAPNATPAPKPAAPVRSKP